jgi:hypothetical protein
MVTCCLCGQDIGYVSQDDHGWKSYGEILTETDDSPQSTREPLIRDEHCGIHSACWKVAARVINSDHYGREWLVRFWNYSQTLSTALDSIPSDVSPDLLEREIYLGRDDSPSATTIELLPAEMISMICQFLSPEDAISFGHVVLVDPKFCCWEEMARKYDVPTCEGSHDTIRRIVRNLYAQKEPKFPHATNYLTVWRNVETIITSMSATGSIRESNQCVLKTKVNLIVTVGLSIGRVTGLAIDGHWVGTRGQCWSAVRCKRLTRLFIAGILGQGPTAIGFWTGNEFDYHGEVPPENDHQSFFGVIMLNPREDRLLLSIDVSLNQVA